MRKPAVLRRRKMLIGRLFYLLAALALLFFTDASLAQVQSQRPTRRLITESVNDSKTVTLAGNMRPEATAQNDMGPVANDLAMQHMQLQLRLPAEKEQELEQLIRDQQDPSSPKFHKWLTGDQFKQQFSVAPEDVEIITNWLKSHGFTVNVIYPRSIDFSGTAGQVESAFQTEIHSLKVKDETHFANMSDPKIPEALAPVVAGIIGLHNFMPRPMNTRRPQYTPGTGYYPVVPADLATIYNVNPLFAKGISGQGQTIVVVEDSDVFSTTDISTFRSVLGLSGYTSGSFTQVNPAPGEGGNCTDPGPTGDDAEATLDVEWASAGAPNASIVLASCANTNSSGVFIALINILTNGGPTPAIISISYGESETELGAAANGFINSLFQQAASEGVSIFVAAADQAAAVSDRGANTATHGINVNGEASTPYNVAVGGTDFGDTFAGTNSTYWSGTNSATFGSALSYVPEIPWNDSCASVLISTKVTTSGTTYGTSGFCNSATGINDFLAVTGGSGGPSGCATGAPSSAGIVGGTCAGYAKPAWQSVFGNPNDGVRDTPDVSLFAANGVWLHYYVVCYSDTGQGGGACTGAPDTWSGFGGTSVATPIMAAFQALVNQSTGTTWGNPNPTYYALADAEYGASGSTICNSTLGNGVASTCVFYDVTQGDMDVPCTGIVNCYLPSGTNGVLSTGPVGTLTVTAGGTGYTSAPTCTLSAPSNQGAYSTYTGGVQATCKATLTGAVVTGLTITNGGAGYAGNPICLLTGGAGTGATCTAATGLSAAYQPAFGTTPGWDFATGIGTVNTSNLVSQWPSTNTITVTSGSSQSATVLTAFTNKLVATVKTTGGVAVSGAVVTFTPPSTGASVTFAGGLNTATTNTSGVATSAVITANAIAGTSYNVLATTPGANANNFTLTNNPGPAAMLGFITQPSTVAVSSSITPPVQVAVQDAEGNTVTTATTSIAIAIGTNPSGGTLSGTTPVPAANGVATFSNLSINKLGTGYTLRANGGGFAATSAAFNVTAGPPAQLAFTVEPPASVSAGASIAPPVQVSVEDALGNVVTSVPATPITVAIGTNPSAGTLSGTLTVNTVSGVAAFPGLSINNTGVGYTITSNGGGLPQATSTAFTVTTATAAKVTATTGSGQSTTISTAFTAPLVATATDSGGNPVSGVMVTFTPPAAGASGTFAPGGNTATTGANGVATSGAFTANATAGGPYNVVASATGATSANFAMTNTAGAAAKVTPTTGSGQSTTISTAFAAPLVATATDSGGNPVSGVMVTFTPPAAGASGTFAPGGNTAATGANGVATSGTFTANATAGGPYNVVASATGATSANFAMTNKAGAAAKVTATSGSGQSAAISTAFAAPLVATVTDSGGNPVSGVMVTFTPPAAGASGIFAPGGNTAATGANGVATSGIFTANATAGGPYSVVASATGATSANFAMTNTAGVAAKVTATTGSGQSTTISTAFGALLVATVTDSGGNPVSGVMVTFTPPAAGASGTFAPGGNTATTGANGVATSGVFTANATAGGPYNVVASATGATSANFAMTNKAGAASKATATSGSGQSAAISTTFAAPLVATVTDSGGNPVSGVMVTFTPPAAGASGTFAPGGNTATTGASGVATSGTFTANATAGGPYNVVASATGATSANFAMANTAGAAAKVAATSGTPQSIAISTPFAAPLVATVTDSGGNPVSGIIVTFTVNPSASGASATFTGVNTATTNAQGVAAANTLTANGIVGSYSVTASVAGIAGTATFTLTNLAGPPATITASSGTPQTVLVNTPFATLKAVVKDAGGNPVSGVAVTFTAPGAGASGIFTGATNVGNANTDATGTASAPTFTANFTNGAYVVNATVGAVNAPAPFSLTNTAGLPTLTAPLSPPSATAGGLGFPLTVNGTNFTTTSVVSFNGVATTTTFVNATQLMAAITAADIATAGTVNVSVTTPAPGGGPSGSLLFTINNPVPTITSLSPPSATAGTAGFPLTVNGTNFVASSLVSFNGGLKPTTFKSATLLIATISAADIANGGIVPVTVINPAPGGGTSTPATQFTIDNAQPTIASLSPPNTLAGAAAFPLMINGNGFVNGATVTFNGTPVTAMFVNSTQLTAQITAAAVVKAGLFNVIVTNPPPSVGPSLALTFTVNNPVPTLTSLGQTHVAAGTAFTLTVNGTNFNSTSAVNFGTKAETTTLVSATQITAAIPASDVATAGPVTVTVVNPAPGGGPTPTSISFTLDGYTIAGPGAPVIVKAGVIAVIPITITPSANGFANPVVFSVTGLPKDAALTPLTVTPGLTKSTVNLMITSMASSSAPPSSPMDRPLPPTVRFLLISWLAALLVGIYGAILIRRTPRLRRYAVLVPLALLLISGGVLAGCSSLSMKGTPVGSYPLSVTATSGTFAQSTPAGSVTLTVQ